MLTDHKFVVPREKKKKQQPTRSLLMDVFPTTLASIASVAVSVVSKEAAKLPPGPSSLPFMLQSSKHAVSGATVKVPVAA